MSFERMVAAEGLLEGGLYETSNVRFSAKRLSLSLPICFYSLFCWLMPMASTPRTGIAGVKAIL